MSVVTIGSGRAQLPLGQAYGDASIYTYTNRTLPSTVKAAIVTKFAQGWFEPHLRPGQRAFNTDCTPWEQFRDVDIEIRRDLDAPCNILLARTGFGIIVGLLVWARRSDGGALVLWLTSDRPGLGKFLVNCVVRRAQAQAQASATIAAVSPGYRVVAYAGDCRDDEDLVFSTESYWTSQGFVLDRGLSDGYYYYYIKQLLH